MQNQYSTYQPQPVYANQAQIHAPPNYGNPQPQQHHSHYPGLAPGPQIHQQPQYQQYGQPQAQTVSVVPVVHQSNYQNGNNNYDYQAHMMYEHSRKEAELEKKKKKHTNTIIFFVVMWILSGIAITVMVWTDPPIILGSHIIHNGRYSTAHDLNNAASNFGVRFHFGTNWKGIVVLILLFISKISLWAAIITACCCRPRSN